MITVGTYFSTVSQADADAKAQNEINNNGQAYANANGTCNYSFQNVSHTALFTKNNCAPGGVGSSVTYSVAAGTYTSSISAQDAENQALNDLNINGQALANTGTCTFSSITKSGTFTRNNCGTGVTGSAVVYTINAGAYSSTLSQADADAKAQSALNTGGQAYANSNGLCNYIYVRKRISGTGQMLVDGGYRTYTEYSADFFSDAARTQPLSLAAPLVVYYSEDNLTTYNNGNPSVSFTHTYQTTAAAGSSTVILRLAWNYCTGGLIVESSPESPSKSITSSSSTVQQVPPPTDDPNYCVTSSVNMVANARYIIN